MVPNKQTSDSPMSPSGSDPVLRAERAESRLAEILATMPEGYITINRDWKITYANPRTEELARRPAQSFVGRSVWECWPHLAGTPLEQEYRNVMEQRIPAEFEHQDKVTGTWFDLRVYPTDDGIAVFCTEISERRQAQNAMQEFKRRYLALTKLNPQMILLANTQGDVTFASPKLLEYSGLTLEETCGQGWRKAVHPEDDERVLQSWMAALQSGMDFEIETRIRRADGVYRWFLVRGIPVLDDDGQTLYWMGVCIDIHARKAAEEELHRSRMESEQQREELETVYRTAPIGLALFDPVEFRYLRLNDRQAEIVGLPMEQILGKTLTEIAPIPGLREMFEQVLAGQPVVNFLLEGELPMRPGDHRYWTVNYFPVYASDGSVRAITAASLEITAQKRVEKALIQSEKLAAVGRLASSISHEINNPLESVTNLLYLAVSHDSLPEEVRRYLETAQEELARVSQIATQALRFHRQAANPTWVSTAELMNSVQDLYRGRLANTDIHVQAKYRATRPVLCFENDIRQVLTNLIANAIDAMRRGGLLLLRTHNATDWKTGRRGVRLTVADTGRGIPKNVRNRLFEAFYTTKELSGTGLGLWISQGIADRHQGVLRVRSRDVPGRSGTVFTLFLPEEFQVSP
jgi:PAS domain S-box-containing protein